MLSLFCALPYILTGTAKVPVTSLLFAFRYEHLMACSNQPVESYHLAARCSLRPTTNKIAVLHQVKMIFHVLSHYLILHNSGATSTLLSQNIKKQISYLIVDDLRLFFLFFLLQIQVILPQVRLQGNTVLLLKS